VDKPDQPPDGAGVERTMEYELACLRQRIAELQELVKYQPFGRDEGVRALEAKVDLLRAQALAAQAERDAARHGAEDERGRLLARLSSLEQQCAATGRELAAVHASTCWRITAPLRRAARLLGR
jgi:hypothetical protein